MTSSLNSLDTSGYDVPGRGRGLLDVFRRRYLLRLLVRKGTATRYRNSVMGWTWSYVKPASQFFIYYFIMGIVLRLHQSVENFAIFLFAGVVLVNLFNEAFGNATSSIVDNRALIKKIYLPRELFPVSAILVALIHFGPQAAVLLLAAIITGWVPTVTGILAILGGIVLVIVWALALGLLFGGVNVRFRDAQNFVEIIRMFGTWTSPVLYSWMMVYDALPNWLFGVYMLNPLTIAVELFHYGFWGPTTTDGAPMPPHFLELGLASGAMAIVILVIGQVVFRHFERTFAQDL